MILLFSILVFLAVALAASGTLLHRSGATGRALDRRLRGLGTSQERSAPRIEVERDVRYSAVPWLDRLLRSLRFGDHLGLLIYQSGLNLRVGVLVLLSAVFAVGGYLLGYALFHRTLPGVAFLALIGPLPYLVVLHRKNRRMQAFAESFPDALDLLVSALRAGLSFSAAMQMVAAESPEPIRGEFAVTVEEQALGLDFREALMHLLKRVDSIDLRFFVTAVILQRDTGGNLAEILENTARLIRDRFRVLGDVRTFTAQGKFTGTVLMLLPVIMMGYMVLVSPEYFKPMIESEGGRTVLIVAGILQVLGMIAIGKIVNIRV
jgi:tight adherence protein B